MSGTRVSFLKLGKMFESGTISPHLSSGRPVNRVHGSLVIFSDLI